MGNKIFGGKQAPPFVGNSQKNSGPKALPTNLGEIGKIPPGGGMGAMAAQPFGPFGRKKKNTYNPNILKSSYTQTP